MRVAAAQLLPRVHPTAGSGLLQRWALGRRGLASLPWGSGCCLIFSSFLSAPAGLPGILSLRTVPIPVASVPVLPSPTPDTLPAHPPAEGFSQAQPSPPTLCWLHPSLPAPSCPATAEPLPAPERAPLPASPCRCFRGSASPPRAARCGAASPAGAERGAVVLPRAPFRERAPLQQRRVGTRTGRGTRERAGVGGPPARLRRAAVPAPPADG